MGSESEELWPFADSGWGRIVGMESLPSVSPSTSVGLVDGGAIAGASGPASDKRNLSCFEVVSNQPIQQELYLDELTAASIWYSGALFRPR